MLVVMAEGKEFDKGQIMALVLKVASSAAVAVAASDGVVGPAAGAGLAVALDSLCDATGGWVRNRNRRRFQQLIEGYIRASDGIDPDVVEARLQAAVENADVQGAVLEAVRGLDEALSDVAIPALARLLRLYTMGTKPADAFFRGVRRVLQELNPDAFNELVAALRTFRDAPPSEVREIRADTAPFNTPNMPDLIGLLNANRLSHDPTAGGMASATGPFIPTAEAIIESRRAQQILVILDSREKLRWVEPD
jgi:hypothetical protein